MRWRSDSERGYVLPREDVDSHAGSPQRDLPIDGPQVCLLYESKTERDELSTRLREAKLDELPWELVEVRPAQRHKTRLEAMRQRFGRISDALGAGSVAALATLGSEWTLVAALAVSLLPPLLIWRLIRGLNPPRIIAAE